MARSDEARSLLRRARALSRSHTNERIEAWKEEGRPVVGYFCPYVPPELVLSVGALPLRLRASGSDDSSLGDAYMSGRLCTYVRHVVSLALEGQFDFLDGQITLNTCDHVRRATDSLQAKTSIGFHGFVSVPRAPREDLLPYYRRELERLRDGLARHLGVSPREDDLREAMSTMNAVRERLARLDALRLEDRPRLSGADALAVNVASTAMPPSEFLDFADELLAALEASDGLESPRGRLVMIGPELDNPRFVDEIESQGALVVADLLCFGARARVQPLDVDAADPLDEIARVTLFKTPCARMIGAFPERYRTLVETVEQARADGVVFARLMFCDPWGADAHNIAHRLRDEAAFPILSLTREYGMVPTGQLRTRVQAFVERLEIARARAAKEVR